MKPALLSIACLWCCCAPTMAEEPLQKGGVLVLTNHRTLKGDIVRQTGRYEIRRNLGKTWIAEDRVLALCKDLAGAYTYLMRQINQDDPDEHLRLARWCFVQKMHDAATKEIQVALRLRPDHEESQRLLRYFKMQAARAKAPAPVKVPDVMANKLPELEPMAQMVTLHEDSLRLFSSTVQPLLMNACVNCHSGDHSGKFKLKRVATGRLVNRSVMNRNLLAVLGQVDPDTPAKSSLLRMAYVAHGGASKAPLTSQQLPALASLQKWVSMTVEKNPHLKTHLASSTPTAVLKKLPNSKPRGQWRDVDDMRLPTKGSVPFGAGAEPQQLDTKPKVVPEARTIAPVKAKPDLKPQDDYDPVLFNQHNHPERFKTPEPK